MGYKGKMETIGKKLRAAREKMNMSSADVAKAVRINTRYIEAIENNDFHDLIAPIYAKGFIKLYAQCVQLDPAPLMRQFNAREVSAEPAPVGHALADKKETYSLKKRRFPKMRLDDLAAVIKNGIKKIKLPEIKQFSVPVLIPVAAPVKKRIVLTVVVAAFCTVLLPVLVKHMAAAGAKVRVPPAARWVAEPPEPYLNLPAQKTADRR